MASDGLRRPTMVGVIAIICIVCIIGWWWCWLNRCKNCPTEEEKPIAQIVLPDEHAAVWQVIDNHFTHPHVEEGESVDYRDFGGILFQFGRFQKDCCQIEVDAPEKITIEWDEDGDGSTESEELRIDQFDWINVVPTTDVDGAKTFSEWVYLLYPDPDTPEGYYACGEVDPPISCVDDGVTDACEDTDSNCSYCADEPVPGECLRMRSLRAFFEPKAIMTYWAGDNGYTVEAEYVSEDPASGDRELGHTFELKDAVTALVWLDESLVGEFSNVTKVTVLVSADTDHGEIHQPPIGNFNEGGGGGSGSWEPFP